MNESTAALSIDECKKLFSQTRDFGLYLDMLDRLKNQYLIILCLKNTTGQNISEETAEKIRRLGFSNFTAEPEMKYAGVLRSGEVVCDISLKSYDSVQKYGGSLPEAEVQISFEEKEAEIRINGKDEALNDKGINIVVYDLKKSKLADVSCCDASEGKPAFYHRNFYYTEQYIGTHIFMPESYLDNVTLPLRKSYFSPRSLNVREVERGIFLPSEVSYNVDGNGNKVDKYKAYGGVCDESFNFIAGHQLLDPEYTAADDRHISGSYKVPPENIAYVDETVLYGGTLTDHPGHLIAESFADRLWWLAENPDSDIKVAIEIIWNDGELAESYNKSFVMEFLDAFGLPKERLIVIKKPTMFKKIIVPDQSAIPLRSCFPYEFTAGYIKPYQHITDRLTPGEHRKIYLTKSKLHNQSTVGEEYFIDFFEKKGFKIIHPEDYTIKEKAELMYGAEEVVTIDGTNSLFSVFCKPSVKLTVLTRRMDYWDTPQQLVTEALGIKDFYLVNVSGNFLESVSSNKFANYARGMILTYATKEFAKYVKYTYNEELDITPDESLKKHFFDYLTYFPEYYIRPDYFRIVSSIKMTDILQSMSEVFLGKKLDTGSIAFFSDDEIRNKELENQLRVEQKANEQKMGYLAEKAKEYIDEITQLKQALARLEAENQQLRKDNSELSAYMSEISQLLDALESQGDPPSEQ